MSVEVEEVSVEVEEVPVEVEEVSVEVEEVPVEVKEVPVEVEEVSVEVEEVPVEVKEQPVMVEEVQVYLMVEVHLLENRSKPQDGFRKREKLLPEKWYHVRKRKTITLPMNYCIAIGDTAECVVLSHDGDMPALPKVLIQVVRNEVMDQLCFCALPQSVGV